MGQGGQGNGKESKEGVPSHGINLGFTSANLMEGYKKGLRGLTSVGRAQRRLVHRRIPHIRAFCATT